MSTLSQCQICWFVQPSLNFRVCQLCQNKYHQICYFQSRPKQQDHCQACSHVMEQKQGKKPKMEPVCYVCNKNDGLMKQIQDNKFVHIFCALTSRNFEIQTYQKFKVSIKNEIQSLKCKVCKKQSSHLIQCQLCEYKAHYTCLTSDQQYVGMNLQQNLEAHHFLYDLIDNQNITSETFDLIKKLRPNWKNQSKQYFKSVACPAQSKKYCWCFCGNSQLNDQDYNPSILCDGCNRYVHLSCSKMKNPHEQKSFFCVGCKSKQKYNKYAKFPQLIQQIIKLETASLNISDIRAIDSFPFIWSSKLISNLKKQTSKVIDYLAIKIINDACSKKKEKTQTQSFFDLVKLVACQKKSSKQPSQIWLSYCILLKEIDPESAGYIYNLKSPEAQQKQIQRKRSQIIANTKEVFQVINSFIKTGVMSQISLITRRICKARQYIRQSNQIRDLVEKHLGKSLLVAFLLFKTSSANEEKIIQMLMCHYFQGRKMTSKELQQLRVTKRRGCPNFQTEDAWQILESEIRVDDKIKPNKNFETFQQRKISNDRRPDRISKILAKVLQNRLTNPKIYLPLKNRTLNRQISTELEKKILVCFQWSMLSKKVYFGLEKKKMSISGIFQARRQMKKCMYPGNKLSQKIEQLYQFCKPTIKLLKRIKSYKNNKQSLCLDMINFDDKPSVGELEYALRQIKESKHPEVWADLQIIQIQAQLKKLEVHRKNLLILIKQLNLNIEQTSPVSPSMITCQKLKAREIISLKKQIMQGAIKIVNVEQYYQVMNEAALAEIEEKNSRWMSQKQSERENQQQLGSDLANIFSKMKQEKQFQGCCAEDLWGGQAEEFLLSEFKKMGEVKFTYFNRHFKRNKKWAEDLKNLQKGLIKYINYQQICCLQVKLKTSIFNHQKFLNQIIIPSKAQCLKASSAIRQQVPYCKVVLHNISLKQNIYSPQNKLYKQVKELKVKDYPLRLYEKDCETLKNLTTLQQKMLKRPASDYESMLDQFEHIYEGVSIYLHELKTVWDLVFKVSEKLVCIYQEVRTNLPKESRRKLLCRHKRLGRVTKNIAEFGGVGENMRRAKDLQASINYQWNAFTYGFDGCHC